MKKIFLFSKLNFDKLKQINKKTLSFLLILSIFCNVFYFSKAQATTTWTMEKARFLASRALIQATPDIVETLYKAWSAKDAVEILFPSVNWPDKTAYLSELEAFKTQNSSPTDTTQNRRVYAFKYYRDPYEAKMKLFWLFEDIFSVDVWANNITFAQVENHFSTLYNNSLWNYKTMVKKVLFDKDKPENSFAWWKYLDLLNQPNKDYPNENYARELMQLFLMLEYKPWEDAETPNAQRNYTETDVAKLALILSGFRAWDDSKVYFDNNYHNQNKAIPFLSGSLKTWDSFPFYNTASWTIDNTEIIKSIWWNNWLADNILDYIFSKREDEIASFLSYRLLKYYVLNKPTENQIKDFAEIIKQNNFDIYPSVKYLLASEVMYLDDTMNQIWYKNPIELFIWTLKLLHYKNPQIIDPLINDTSFLTNLDWIPYNPKSIFWRPWFDDNINFFNAYFHNQFVTLTSKFAYSTSSWSYNLSDIIWNTTLVNSWTTLVETSTWNTYSWSINLENISITLKDKTFKIPGYTKPESVSLFSTLKNILSNDDENITQTWSENKTQTWSENINNSWSENETQTWSLETSSWSENTASWIQNETNSWKVLEETKTESWSELKEEIKIETKEEIKEEVKTETNEEVKTEIKDENTNEEKIEENKTSFLNLFIPKTYASNIEENTYLFSTWSVKLPNFLIETGSWLKLNIKWNFNQTNWTFEFLSGSLSYSWSNYEIEKMSFDIKKDYNFSRDLTIDEMFFNIETNLYLQTQIPQIVKDKLTSYLLNDENWVKRTFLPNNLNYQNRYIRWVIAMLLSQSEFILKSWFNKEKETSNNSWSQIKDNSKKLIMIELSGWFDWMNWVIPKTDMEYYKNIRWEMAFSWGDLIDLWDVYLNKNLEAFKEFYDSWDLRIVNRVWAPNHSRWHDTALIQVTSQKALQTVNTPWIIWELIKNESNPLNNIVLGSQRPTVYTNWKYLNIWYNNITYQNPVWNTTQAQKTYQLNTLKDIFNSRTYPELLKDSYDNSLALDNIAKTQSSVWYTLASRLNFTKNLINSDIWITYYLNGWGGYDTHQDQLKPWVYNLNNRLSDLSKDITSFFKDLKNSWKDVTIIVYSEFWRTLKTNWTLWTDHWEGWGYFILSTNNKLKTELPKKVIWKLAPEKEYEDWFGVWIDYRSIYSKILSSLYWIDVNNYFFGNYKLDDYLNTKLPTPIWFRQEYKHSYTNQMNVDFRFKVDDSNFLIKDGSYFKFYYWTNSWALIRYSKWNIDTYALQNDWSFKLNLNVTKNTNYYYKLELVDNQYDTYILTWSFLTPTKFESSSTWNTISLTNDTYFAKHNNTWIQAWETKNISKITLFNNVWTWSVTQSFWDINMTFGTWETNVESLFNSWSNNLVWNWWFLLPKEINVWENIADNIMYSWSLLKNYNVEKLVKIWSDVLWLWMNLWQKVVISLPVNKNTWKYRVLVSEDLQNWSEIPNVIKSEAKIYFATNHFSYFAVYNEADVVVPPVVIPENPTNPTTPTIPTTPETPTNPTYPNTWSWTIINPTTPDTWSWVVNKKKSNAHSLSKDFCVKWDYSWNLYDRKCDAKIIINSVIVTKDIVKIPETKFNYSKVNILWYELVVVKNNKLSQMLNEFELKLIQDEKITSDQKNYIIQSCNEFMTASYFLDISKKKTNNLQINFQRKKIAFQWAINIYLMMKNS